MPKTSTRSVEMPSSPIRKLLPFAVEAERRGVTVNYLNIGQPDIASPETFWEGLREGITRTLAYSASPGQPHLREVAAADYTRRGISVDSANVLVTAGGSEATLFAFLTCFNPGDEVLVIEPYYANYLGFAVEAGLSLVAITTRIEDDFALPSLTEMEAYIGPKTRGILICNPSNPTGTCFSIEHLEGLAQLARKRDLFLIADEVYRDFNYSDVALTSVLNLPGMADHAVMIDSVSKRFSLCGARVGFLVSRNPQIMGGATKLAQARLSVGTLEQAGVARAIESTPPSYFSDIRAEYQRRRDVLIEELSQVDGVIVPNVNGAFYAIVSLPVENAESFCQWLLSDFSLDGQTVMLAPAEGFYLTPGHGKREVRIAYVLEESKIRTSVRCLQAALKQYAAVPV